MHIHLCINNDSELFDFTPAICVRGPPLDIWGGGGGGGGGAGVFAWPD